MDFKQTRDTLKNNLRETISPDLNFDPTEPLAQIVDVVSVTGTEFADLLESCINDNSIMANGDKLDLQLAMQGKRRLRATTAKIYSFTIICDDTCTLTRDDFFQNANGLMFRPVEEKEYLAGTHLITIEAVEAGMIDTPANKEISVIVSPVSGLDSAENDYSSPNYTFYNGRNTETDTEARLRLAQQTNANSYTINAIEKAVTEIDGVDSCIVTEKLGEITVIVNQKNMAQEVTDLIFQTIAFSKPAGIICKGTETQIVEIGKKSYVTIKYTKAMSIDIYIKITATPTLTPDEKNALSNYIAKWSQDLQPAKDFVIYGTGGLFDAVVNWGNFDNLKIMSRKVGGTWSMNNIAISNMETANIKAGNVQYD